MNGGNDRASSCLIQNGRCPGGQVGSNALLEVEGKLGLRQQVGVPVAGAARSSRHVDMPIDIVEPDLYAAGLPGFPACR
jgi:hypothetical protein